MLTKFIDGHKDTLLALGWVIVGLALPRFTDTLEGGLYMAAMWIGAAVVVLAYRSDKRHANLQAEIATLRVQMATMQEPGRNQAPGEG